MKKGNLSQTHKELGRKVTLIRVENTGEAREDTLVGWELAPPHSGTPYMVYLGAERALKTTDVRDVRESNGAVMIQTLNSVYRIEYRVE